MRPDSRRGMGTVLTTWPFTMALACLIANDAWLKPSYPGLVTGKLSDVAGIALIALLLLAAFPRRPGLVCIGLSAAFAAWKSPLSQPLIDAFNALAILHVGRTIDYLDLAGLLVLPACLPVARRPADFQLPGAFPRPLLRVPLVAATAFAVMATPATPPATKGYELRSLESARILDRDAILRAIAGVAVAHGLECLDCRNPREEATYGKNGLWLHYTFSNDHRIEVRFSATPRNSRGQHKIDKLSLELKKRFAEVQPGLEYSEFLRDPEP